MDGFFQSPPRLPSAWESDWFLRQALRYRLGNDLYELAEPELAEMGQVATDPATLALAARAEAEPPSHVPFGPWGQRIDDIKVSDAYLELGRIGVAAGVTGLPYETTDYGPKARLVWAGLLDLWGSSSALYSCPVAMTDGAARTLLDHGDKSSRSIVERLTSRGAGAWTSGQWMTETAGGSDLGRTGTVARLDADGSWRLTGTKWFTSATTSEVALTLAVPENGRGLALFRIQRTLDDGTRNSIVVRRLKDKLGTRSLPTAELELVDALAYPVGEPRDGGGVRRMSTMLNITRLHNSVGSTSAIARGLAWARAYAEVREVFGRPLAALPAHRATLNELAVDRAVSLVLALDCAALLGRVEQGSSGPEATMLRILTPIAKLSTARWAVAGVAEAMEAVGGVGYCEDSTIPALVRNTHVLPIWEGTTNVLALDMLRVLRRDDARALLFDHLRTHASRVAAPSMTKVAAAVQQTTDECELLFEKLNEDDEQAQAWARPLALTLATTYACLRLCEQAAWAEPRGEDRTGKIAHRLVARGLMAPPPPEDLGL